MQKIILVFIFILFISTISLAGGPWPQKKGNGYFKLSQWWIVFDQHYNDAGKITSNRTAGIHNTSLYAEYGFTDRLTGVLYFPFFSRNILNNVILRPTGQTLIPGEAINTVGDTDVSLKYAINKPGSKVPIAATLTLGLPLGKTEAGDIKSLQTGDGEFNQMLQVDAGSAIKLGSKAQGFISGQLGFNNRTNGFSDEFRFGLEGGVGLINKKLWIIARLTGVESLKNEDTVADISNPSIFANNKEYLSYGVEFAYYVTKKIGVSAGYASAFSGANIAGKPSYSVGVFYDLKR